MPSSRQILPLRMPVGIADFKRLRTEGSNDRPYWFADKTDLIAEIIDDAPVILITRPRRFGKTLNMSMLQYFFNLKGAQQNKILFNGLKITKRNFIMKNYQGQYLVIFLTLKDIKTDNFKQTLESFKRTMADLYDKHLALREEKLQSHHEAFFNKILTSSDNITEQDLELSLKRLIIYLNRYYDKNIIVLIDEYDTPLLSAFYNGFLDKFLKFYRNFLGNALKDNEAILYKTVLTGIVRIAGAGLFSGLNNHQSYSILDERYSGYFGFTQKDVIELLDKIHRLEYLNRIEQWYNGYRFADHTIYNPWSVLCCVNNNFRFKAYWVHTSDDRLLKKCLLETEDTAKAYFAQLIAKSRTLEHESRIEETKSSAKNSALESQSKVLKINLSSFLQLNDPEPKDISSLVTLLLSSGYLTAEIHEEEHHLSTLSVRIPNVEVRGIYAEIFSKWIHRKISQPDNNLIGYLRQSNINAFCEGFKTFFLQSVSYHDVGRRKKEGFYHGFLLALLGLMMNTHEGYLFSNRESGLGRYDILFEPYHREKDVGIIIELKRTPYPTRLKSETRKGIEQIYDSLYLTELKHKNVQRAAIISFAFCGKRMEYLFAGPNAIDILLSKNGRKILPRKSRNSRKRSRSADDERQVVSTRPTKRRKLTTDNHWYTDDEINTLLAYYLREYPNIELMIGISLNLQRGDVLSHNLAQREREIERIEQATGPQTIVLPINLGNRHWVALYIHHAAAADRMQPAIGYFDPLAQRMPRTLYRLLSRRYSRVNPDDYLISPIQLQHDSYNCGPWVVEILLHLIRDLKLPPEHFDIMAARAEHQTILQRQEQKH